MHRRSNHFMEKFSESSANLSGNAGYGEDQGYPIQLLKVKSSGKLELSEEALDLIAQCDLPVGFVTMSGEYRIGKSFLLNKLLDLQARGFKVESTPDACTKGIWMWSSPIFNEQKRCYLFFVDTEGSESISRDVENDTKIFTMAALISSYFIFNSKGTIQAKSISQLNLVTSLSRNIIIDEGVTTNSNQQNLHMHMPKFLWLIRDFNLKLQDERGYEITPNQYLQNSLLNQNTLVRVDQDVAKVKRYLVKYFKDRECLTLVRPVHNESDLQKVNNIPTHLLRKQFIAGLDELKQKILKNAGPKKFQNNELYGNDMACMIKTYVDTLNVDGIPNIKSAWEQITDDEGASAYNKALLRYEEIFTQEFGEEPKGEEIHQSLNYLRQETLDEYDKNMTASNEQYKNKLRSFLNEKEKDILELNSQMNRERNAGILKDCSKQLVRNIEEGNYRGRKNELIDDIASVNRQYNKKARGEDKGELFSEFQMALNPLIINLENQEKNLDQKANRGSRDDLANRQIEEAERRAQQAVAQTTKADKSATDFKKQQEKILKEKKKREEKQAQKSGCCAGKCQIM